MARIYILWVSSVDQFSDELLFHARISVSLLLTCFWDWEFIIKILNIAHLKLSVLVSADIMFCMQLNERLA